MKDYKNVAEDVFRRSNEVIEENKRRRRKRMEIGVSAACWAAVGAIGFGIWRSSGLHVPKTVISEGQFANDGTDHSGESDVVFSDHAKGGAADEYTANSQGSLVGKEPSSGLSPDYPVLDNEYIGKDGVDIRCIPIIHLPLQTENRVIGNGQVLFTGALKEKMTKAMLTEEFLDVVIEYYNDGERVDPTEEFLESERARAGVDFELETLDNGQHCIRGDMTCYMLEDLFVPHKDYGCIVYLRDNFLKELDNKSIKICGRISNINVDVEEPEHSPDNGIAVVSEALKKAVEIYGKEDNNGEIKYDVIVDYYKAGERVETTEEIYVYENMRGSALGFESHSDDFGATWTHRLHKLMTVDEIESFEPGAEYGYVLHLRGAYLGKPYELMDNIINGLYNNGVYFE